jgi:hypothetical protein
MKIKGCSKGFTIIETLIGLSIFLCIIIPSIRYAEAIADSGSMKDQQIAYALLRGECCAMYKNQRIPPPSRLVAVDHREYEISFAAEKDSLLVDWTMTVQKAGKSIAFLRGLLYVPAKGSKPLP